MSFDSQRPNAGVFLRIAALSQTLRMWAGAGPFPVPSDVVEPGGAEYAGVGKIGGELWEFEQLINGQLQVIELSLSGADAAMIAYVRSSREEIRNAPCHIGLMPLDADYQPDDAMMWFRGVCAAPRVSRQAAAAGTWIRTISISVSMGSSARRRPRHTYLNGPDQRRRSPTDAGADRVGLYDIGATRVWPN